MALKALKMLYLWPIFNGRNLEIVQYRRTNEDNIYCDIFAVTDQVNAPLPPNLANDIMLLCLLKIKLITHFLFFYFLLIYFYLLMLFFSIIFAKTFRFSMLFQYGSIYDLRKEKKKKNCVY